MGIGAFVLIDTEPGKVDSINEEISKIKGVICSWIVTGAIDIVAFVRANTFDDLTLVVMQKIQKLKGIRRTQTCITTSFCSEYKHLELG